MFLVLLLIAPVPLPKKIKEKGKINKVSSETHYHSFMERIEDKSDKNILSSENGRQPLNKGQGRLLFWPHSPCSSSILIDRLLSVLYREAPLT